MLAPGFAEPFQQCCVVSLQEQDLAVDAEFVEFCDEVRKTFQLVGVVTGIDAGGNLAGAGRQLAGILPGKCGKQADRQVVDAVEIHILQCMQGNTLAGAGQTADDDHVHGRAFSRRRFWRSMKELLAS